MKIKTRKNFRIISRTEWSLILIFLLVVEFPNITYGTMDLIRLITIMLCFLLILHRLPLKKLIRQLWPIYLYGISIVISAIGNTQTTGKLLAGVRYALILITIYTVIINAVNRYSYERVIKTLYRIVGVIVVISNLFVFLTNGNGIFVNKNLPNFLFGNKFVISYFNMFFIACFLTVKDPKVWKQIAIIGITSAACTMMSCMTGVIGCVSIYFLFRFKSVLQKSLMKPGIFIGALSLSAVIVMAINLILSSQVVQFILTNILHRSLTMTGRLAIYESLISIIGQHPLIGYGYLNTVVKNVVGYGNPQNGVLNIVVNFGILGVVLFGVTCYRSFPSLSVREPDISYPMICYIYAMVICAIVEVNLSTMFILGIALIAGSKGDLVWKKKRLV